MNSNKPRSRISHPGFTLIELLVVIAIIAILLYVVAGLEQVKAKASR
jgi:prepilin-type N-terminal cleavage/methylation domain-containing protein